MNDQAIGFWSLRSYIGLWVFRFKSLLKLVPPKKRRKTRDILQFIKKKKWRRRRGKNIYIYRSNVNRILRIAFLNFSPGKFDLSHNQKRDPFIHWRLNRLLNKIVSCVRLIEFILFNFIWSKWLIWTLLFVWMWIRSHLRILV